MVRVHGIILCKKRSLYAIFYLLKILSQVLGEVYHRNVSFIAPVIPRASFYTEPFQVLF